MPVILNAPEEWDVWLRAPRSEARALQRPLPAGMLHVVMTLPLKFGPTAHGGADETGPGPLRLPAAPPIPANSALVRKLRKRLFDTGASNVRSIVRELLRVAGLALEGHHPIPKEKEIEALLVAALTVVDRSMPPELQAQDKRVVAARDLLRLIRGTALTRP